MATAIRASYTQIKKKYTRIGKKNVRLTQSSLLLIKPIDPNTTTYTFPILESDNAIAPQPEELRLNINDEFISYDVSYYVIGDQSSSDGATPPVITQLGKVYLTYAPLELDKAFTTLARAWDGYLQILINKISRLEKWDMKKHNFIPRTQYKGVSSGLPYATVPSIDYSRNGTKAMQPMVTLSGAKKNDIIITLTNGAIPNNASGNLVIPDHTVVETGVGTITITASRLGLFFRGMLAQNASKFQ